MNTYVKYIGIVFLAATILAPIAYGASSERQRFQEEGNVTLVDVKAMALSVGESSYKLLSTTRVYSAGGAPTSLAAIRRNQHVRYNLTKSAADHAIVITEIQILAN